LDKQFFNFLISIHHKITIEIVGFYYPVIGDLFLS